LKEKPMLSRYKRLLAVPVFAALYFMHPVLGWSAVGAGFVAVFFVRRAREGMTPTMS